MSIDLKEVVAKAIKGRYAGACSGVVEADMQIARAVAGAIRSEIIDLLDKHDKNGSLDALCDDLGDLWRDIFGEPGIL
jgi:hypothetical protein